MTTGNSAQRPDEQRADSQRPSGMPCYRYRPFPPVSLPDRRWPSATITAAPRWLSTAPARS